MEMILDRNPATKTTTVFHWLNDGDKYIVEEVQDASPILEANTRLRSSFDHHDRKSEMRWVGRIPLTVYFSMRRVWDKLGLSKEEKDRELIKFLNDSDNSKLRVDTTKL
jgi:hypothetical protein